MAASPRPDGRVTLDRVTKRFGDVVAVDDVSLDIADGELLVLLGPSGCGKSTVLRLIAGLDEPSEGSIAIGGRSVDDVEPKDRDVAMVFQSYALYPHLTVRRNIEFPLAARHVPADERAGKVAEAARALDLDALLDRKPAQLSGGQRQRVALARALVRRPAVFLMDEPLSNLDAKLRVQTRAELVELHRRLSTTIVYVTHDQVEAMTMGDRIVIVHEGRLQQVGPPDEVYARPANLFVAGFIGNPPMNTITAVARVEGGHAHLRVDGHRIDPPESLTTGLTDGQRVVAGVRPEHLLLAGDGHLPATVALVESLGHERHVVVRLGDGQLAIARQPADLPALEEGAPVCLTTRPEHLHLFDAETGERLGG